MPNVAAGVGKAAGVSRAAARGASKAEGVARARGTSKAVGKAINEAFDKENWPVARERIVAALEREPDSHWLLSKLSATYYEEREYQQALEYAQKAAAIAPECPIVSWDLAGALLATNDPGAALRIYLRILDGGPAKAASCPHGAGEGEKWALSLLIDCLFMAGVCEQRLGEKSAAIDFFLDFVENVSGWTGCVNTPEDAIKRIREIENREDKSRYKAEIEEAKELMAV
jgi:tetratricopeptide (TPR) repeat protein